MLITWTSEVIKQHRGATEVSQSCVCVSSRVCELPQGQFNWPHQLFTLIYGNWWSHWQRERAELTWSQDLKPTFLQNINLILRIWTYSFLCMWRIVLCLAPSAAMRSSTSVHHRNVKAHSSQISGNSVTFQLFFFFCIDPSVLVPEFFSFLQAGMIILHKRMN